jgi:hypothetical protein
VQCASDLYLINMGRPSVNLSATLPPLILGTATFNTQYNEDPYSLATTSLVHHALSSGIRAFDTSPYYGPSEELLGRALANELVQRDFPRHTYQLLTKVGRVASSSFDYSPAWVRYSVRRSLQRLHTDYLDVVYCHDVEFVAPAEVLEAVRELRRIRDIEGTVRYVGISGYPVEVLCSLAELVLRETGEPLDVVMSYANFTLQNTLLRSQGLQRLIAAGVDVVPNASPLGMGLLRSQGVPVGGKGDWHPAPAGLRRAVQQASDWVGGTQDGESLEVIAIRYALESWLQEGGSVGTSAHPLVSGDDSNVYPITGRRLGVSVIGVSSAAEIDEGLRLYREVLDDDAQLAERGELSARTIRAGELVQGIQSILGTEWIDFAWASPGDDFVNTLSEDHYRLLKLDVARERAEDPSKSITTSIIKEPEITVNVSEIGTGTLTPPGA